MKRPPKPAWSGCSSLPVLEDATADDYMKMHIDAALAKIRVE